MLHHPNLASTGGNIAKYAVLWHVGCARSKSEWALHIRWDHSRLPWKRQCHGWGDIADCLCRIGPLIFSTSVCRIREFSAFQLERDFRTGKASENNKHQSPLYLYIYVGRLPFVKCLFYLFLHQVWGVPIYLYFPYYSRQMDRKRSSAFAVHLE